MSKIFSFKFSLKAANLALHLILSSFSKHPITKIADVADLKFRVPQSAVLLESYRSWGANPVPISWAETFTALQQGVVDGQCYGYITFQAAKFNEVQKYISEVHYT